MVLPVGRFESPALPVHYRGTDRRTAIRWPDEEFFPEETLALEKSLFGRFYDDRSLIPTLEKAVELWQAFQDSPRPFEIVYCRTISTSPRPLPAGARYLGCDLSSKEDVGMSPLVAEPYRNVLDGVVSQLNAHGLFEDAAAARSFARKGGKSAASAGLEWDFVPWEIYEIPAPRR